MEMMINAETLVLSNFNQSAGVDTRLQESIKIYSIIADLN